MLHQPRISTVIKRTTLVLLSVCLFGMMALAAPRQAPAITNVTATTSGQSTLITVSGTSPLPFSVSRPDARTIVVELPGVDMSRVSQNVRLTSPLVDSVTVDRGRKAGLRIALRAAVIDKSQLADNNLVLVLTPKATVEAAHAVKTLVPEVQAGQNPAAVAQQPSPSPTPRPARMQQSDQGQRYGESGFMGEPINLNVVNADIRDILNYITEQYGINFVIDSSVNTVPVTVNVQDVPWNIALDAVLKANRLGVEVNGNILRVATMDTLAKEAETQKVLKDSRLDASALVTEFIRLNYARASGTLSQGGGASGNFAGGVTQSVLPSAGGQGQGGGQGSSAGSDQGILPVVQRRLSRRGSVEVDGRSNTLIITDVKENIDSIRQLVTLLDQPEPQVEIETRIVIANRSFSRDLGVQLNALAINTTTGGTAGIGTAQPSPLANASGGATNTIGLRPSGIPQGILNPSGALGANLPNTVIGLTTGVIGTAQISALITAAESRGLVKIVATPRVTALNNRKAEISSGQQIPVTTPQTGAGGTGGVLVFTTTFVSVPLRLEVTPQITDAGTVVLHVIAENNSVNTSIAINGTPGIDTQRMETEVLVPDGGTTVVGGVLGDNEATTQNRTPGVASIPIVGNLFKRKLVTRQSNEILFFITPHIYRPDYQGRPTTTVVGTGTTNRTVTIPQPVPLGNPSTNTPAPNPNAQPAPVQPSTQPAPAQRPNQD
ncbi:MAG TPA: type IV pilus secretin PilQ [Pyrinomonadaceae bacterium]|nr:type IV pilus secretin PilQ [Pyrinomonadaceae bacterium]